MIRSISVFLLLVASASVSAQQSAHDYSFLQASYSKVDAGSSLDDGDGLGVSLSYGLTPNFHIFGGYLGIDTNSNVDAGGWRAGIGLNTPLSQQLDIVVRLSYQTTERPAPGPGGGSVDDDGLAFGAGVRAAVNNRIELYGGLNYIDLDSGNETVLDAGFLFSLNRAFALGVSTTWDDDVSAWSLDGRLYFE
ncbi:MAG: porin family protein [Gammaproteobacteria bacterium]|nr:porin family protein [Gammaproteobacteria bacterium]